MRLRRSAIYLAQLLLASLSGYLLVRLVSFVWGTSEPAAAFEIAWSIPMLLITASGLNVVQAVTARFFSDIDIDDATTVSEYLSSFLNIFGLLLIPLILLVAGFRTEIAGFAAPGLSPEMRKLTADLLLIMVPLAGLFGFGLFFGGVYAAYAKPVTAELVLLLTRITAVVVVTMALIVGIDVSPEFLASVLLGAGILATVYVGRLARTHLGFQYRLTLVRSARILKSLGLQTFLFLLVAVLGQAIIVYFRSLLSEIDTHLVAAFSYALLITYTFSNIVGKLSFFDTTLPSQKAFSANDFITYRSEIVRSSLIYGLIGLIVALLLAWQSELAILVLFGGGAFDSVSLQAVKTIFDILIYSVPATTLIWVLKVPSITGPFKLALPATELMVWLTLLALTQIPAVAASPEWITVLLCASYWVRVLLATAIIALQVSAQRRLAGSSRPGALQAKERL